MVRGLPNCVLGMKSHPLVGGRMNPHHHCVPHPLASATPTLASQTPGKGRRKETH